MYIYSSTFVIKETVTAHHVLNGNATDSILGQNGYRHRKLENDSEFILLGEQ